MKSFHVLPGQINKGVLKCTGKTSGMLPTYLCPTALRCSIVKLFCNTPTHAYFLLCTEVMLMHVYLQRVGTGLWSHVSNNRPWKFMAKVRKGQGLFFWNFVSSLSSCSCMCYSEIGNSSSAVVSITIMQMAPLSNGHTVNTSPGEQAYVLSCHHNLFTLNAKMNITAVATKCNRIKWKQKAVLVYSNGTFQQLPLN